MVEARLTDANSTADLGGRSRAAVQSGAQNRVISDEDVLRELQEFEKWYDNSTWRWGKALFVLRTMSILTGFLVALLTGLTVGHQSDQDGIKITIIVLSGFGTLAATFLSQYRVGEVERLRASGRIGCQGLRLKAQYKLPMLEGSARAPNL